jgi:hypothetical protein
VVASTVAGVEVGERFYGYLPIASHLHVKPERVTARGFYDGAQHRKSLTSAYNQYARCSRDPTDAPTHENHQMIVRPLFITSFMLADFLQDNSYFGARQLVVSCASSKTAYGTAFCLQGEREVELVALTSERNAAFVEGLGCYRRTATYDALASATPRDVPTLYVDFSGDETLRERVHHHFGDALVYDCFVGSAQNTRFLRETGLPGPAPKFFFAPVQIKKRNADWGHALFNRKFNAATLGFVERIADSARPWMEVVEGNGYAAAQALIERLHAGRTDPREGHVVVLGD